MAQAHSNASPSRTERAIWAALALAGGCATGWFDLGAAEVQGTAAVLMLTNFALTLPGRAPVALVAIASALGLPLVHAGARGDVNAGYVIILIPAFIGAGGGRLAGRLLDTASSQLEDVPSPSNIAWRSRPLSTRFLLAVALVLIAAAGLPSANAALTAMGQPTAPFGTLVWAVGHRSASFVALVWEIMTLLGWIGLTPILLAERPTGRVSAGGAIAGLSPTGVATHLLMIVVLTVVHAALVVAFTGLLFIPIEPDWQTLARTAFTIYLPLDMMAYLTILTLGFASDVARQRRATEQREAALRAESLDSRLTALRARLNPHFLFNALNSVHVLARAGKADETSRLVEGLTGLLRYVLDERRATVPLREELSFVRTYLGVQQVRFGDRLRYDVQSDASLDDALVPQLLLQPIVENALEHGVARALDGGSVRVIVARAGDVLRVIVEDDGPGPAAADNSSGIGLASTRERLARLLGARARLVIEPRPSSEGRGTRVVIEIPLESPPTE